MASSKTTSDFLGGAENREKVATAFNAQAMMLHSPIRIRRYHPDIKIMSPSEKQRFNTDRNRNSNDDKNKAMGLDYEIYSLESTLSPIRLQIRFSDGGGHYIKIPSDRLQDVENYIKEIENSTYALFVLKKMDKIYPYYSSLLLLKDILKYGYHMSTAKGNKNRLQLDYNPGTLQYYLLEETRGFFTTSLLNQCETLFK